MQGEKPINENRTHKASLYNALHGTDFQVSDTQLERMNLE